MGRAFGAWVPRVEHFSFVGHQETPRISAKMTGLRIHCLFFFLASISCSVSDEATNLDHQLSPYDFLYSEGINKYLEEDWEKCVENIEGALADWHWWKDNTARCREECKAEVDEAPLFSENLQEEDKFYEGTVRRTLCLVKCKKAVFGSRMDRAVEEHVDEDFGMRKPYDYLQLCYFQLGKFKEAADAAATVLVAQPDHEVMKNNLKYYIVEGGVVAEEVVNREMKPYGKEYVLGTIAYNNQNYPETIEHMEKSLELYYQADEECRRLCENSFEQKILQDFVLTVANQYTFTLRCKANCDRAHGNLLGEAVENFYSTYFHYLQFAYYQEGEIEKACRAIASALYMDPDDSVQLRNKQYYFSNEDVSEDMFIPRERAIAYKERMEYEKNIINYIETSFLFLNDDVMEDVDLDELDEMYTSDTHKNKTAKTLAKQISEKARAIRKRAVGQYKTVSQMGIRVSMTDEELGGDGRMAADGFATPMECLILSELTRMASLDGDGYKKNTSPHTNAENFQGLTLGRTGLMVHANLIAKEVLEMILDVTDNCRDYIERYFNLLQPLYFSFTHLVCRTAKPEKAGNRSTLDLSHEVHADNCILQDSGECLRVPPAYVFRDYSAILYLNHEFEGGEFIFTHDRTGSSYESKIKPQCGRMVAFSAGPENSHGVLPVVEGSRCAIGMWFTHDKRYKEIERS